MSDLRSDFPRRIRVKGGTVIHAVGKNPRVLWSSGETLISACRREVDMDDTVTELNKAAPVSCKACARALGGEA